MCRHFILIYVILAILMIVSSSKPCFIWENHYIQVTKFSRVSNNKTEHFVELEYVGRQNRGWLGFLLSRNKSTQNSISVVGYFPDNILFFKNHTKVISSKISQSFSTVQTLNFKIDGLFSFKVVFNASVIAGFNYITFAQNFNFLPTFTNETHLKKHTSASDYYHFTIDLPDDKYPYCTTTLNFPGRLLGQNWVLYVLSALVLSVVGFIFIYFRNEQPLKSRFVAPLYCIIGTHMNLFSEFIYGLFQFEQSAHFQCAFYGFLIYAAIQFALVIPCLMIIRYAILLQLHFYKRDYIKKNKALRRSSSFNLDSTSAATMTTNISNRAKSKLSLYYEESSFLSKAWKKMRDLLSILKSPWIFIIVPIFWVSFYYCCAFIVFSIGGLRCGSFSRNYMRVVHIGFLGVAFIILILFILLDFFLSIRRWIKCQWKIYFFEEDPFHYRIDMITCIFGLLPMVIIWAIVPLSRMISGVIVDYMMIISLFLTGGNALIITIFKKVKLYIQNKLNERNDSKNPNRIVLDIDMILAEKKLLEIFIKFSDFEWSSENIYFILDVMEYKKQKDIKSKRLLAIQIRENYFIANISPLELNISGKYLKPCLKLIEDNEFTNEIFDNVQKDVEVNVCDTITRFVVSDEYQDYKKYDAERLSNLGL
eukprot:gene6852-11013_t